MKIYDFSMEMGCAGGDPYENISFSMEFGLCGRASM